MLINLIPIQYRIAAGLVAAALLSAGLFVAGYRMGASNGERDLADYKAAVAAQAATQAAQTIAAEREAAKKTEEVENAWFQNLDALHTHYAGRLRKQSANGGRSVPGNAEPAGRADADAADPAACSAAPAPEDCAALERNAAVTTLQLLSLQDWIRQQARGE